MEADGVCQLRASKEGAKCRAILLDTIGLAENIWIIRSIPVFSRSGKHAAIGRNPSDSILGKERNHKLRHGAFRRPHAAWRTSKPSLIAFSGHADLGGRVFGVRKARCASRTRPVDCRAIRVHEERKDRMIVRRRGHLDLSRILQLAVNWDDRPHDLVLLLHHFMNVLKAKVAALLNELPYGNSFSSDQRNFTFAKLRGEPGEIEPHLEITDVLRAERLKRMPPLKKLLVARVWKDLVMPMRVEKTRKDMLSFVARQLFRRLQR